MVYGVGWGCMEGGGGVGDKSGKQDQQPSQKKSAKKNKQIRRQAEPSVWWVEHWHLTPADLWDK